MPKKSLIAVSLSLFLLTACQEATQVNNLANQPVNSVKQSTVLSPSDKANQLFDEIFMNRVMRNPVTQTYLGIKQDYDKWYDLSEEASARELEFTKADLARLKSIDASQLDEQTQLSLRLYIMDLENEISDHQWRYHSYPVNQMYGVHSQIPAFLINQHSIDTEDEAKAYIARLNGASSLIDQLIEQLKLRADKGIIAPKFVFPHVLRDSRNIIQGAPFDKGNDSTLLTDFKSKVDKLSLTDAQKSQLISKASHALTASIEPAYKKLIAYLSELEQKATTDDGAWKFPDGEAFYNNALQRTTTTALTANEIHQIGLNEVARIHEEMREIMKKVEFKGDLAQFFEFMRHDKQFYYPGTDEGKQRYLTEATALIDNMKLRLDELFTIKPKADLIVQQVEAFREKSAGKAFYQQPSPDGSRPGKYYANLYDMDAMPTYQMEALAYHEGIPGHHMQIAIKQELENMPKFRKFGRYTAYTEGWGLYSELIPKEIGLYQDPYSDFGRLAMELWRAVRLVVDTGMHSQKWSRQQGIDFYVSNTPNAKSDAVKMVERHAVMPSQATAYKIGMLKIIELRLKAQNQLGEKFDIREFHNVILKDGALPLNILEDKVNKYIESV
jgi:uncharacterized protein (DUF885 family)